MAGFISAVAEFLVGLCGLFFLCGVGYMVYDYFKLYGEFLLYQDKIDRLLGPGFNIRNYFMMPLCYLDNSCDPDLMELSMKIKKSRKIFVICICLIFLFVFLGGLFGDIINKM